MDFKELLKERRSVRKYIETVIPVEDVEAILEDTRMAPSWKNNQTVPRSCSHEPKQTDP